MAMGNSKGIVIKLEIETIRKIRNQYCIIQFHNKGDDVMNKYPYYNFHLYDEKWKLLTVPPRSVICFVTDNSFLSKFISFH